jgi:hypothetical protein
MFIKVGKAKVQKMFIACVWRTVSIGITGDISKKGVDDYNK